MSAKPGIYDHLLTAALDALVRGADAVDRETEPLDPAVSAQRLARHVAREVERVLAGVPGKGHELVAQQSAVANEILRTLGQIRAGWQADGEVVLDPPQLLLSLHQGVKPLRTDLSYALSTVLTRARGEPAIGHELAREIASADHVDAIVSFVTTSGVRALRESFERFAQDGHPLRLLTTTYTGATDADAVDALALLPGVEVKISYDARRTRLHAKAWLFSRASGLDTAYIGSANLSSSALFHGHEWMVKASAADLPAVIEKFRGTFETLWNDGEFEAYDPRDQAHRRRLREALQDERGGGPRTAAGRMPAFFTLRPYPFQAELLERLVAERELHGRRRNLVVAATGTGKTVIAAFDYHRRIGDDGLRPRLLFLAHRREILQQALYTFRNVLRDGAFGELLADGASPGSHDHLFATIQSFASQDLLARLGADHFDHVVIDECHHAPAESYRPVVDGLRPSVLVGLTATPERTDGASLLPDFCGHIAAELRLWHALERQLLVPFEYYGISDGTDLKNVRWNRGTYTVDGLDNLYTGNDRRAELVLEQTRRRVGDPRRMRALAFCVSVAHAEFMARKCAQVGIPAMAVHGGSPADVRNAVPGRLERREVNVVFTCDLYNEGVDLPWVDTLLLLRPTSSATLFLQQLGRGLRLAEGKESCLVLDFIGQHREEFRFDQNLTQMTGVLRGKLREAVERGFPTLPSGCHLELDRVTREQVLGQLERTLGGGKRRLLADLKAAVGRHGASVSLAQFLEDSGREPAEVFDGKLSWSILRREAGLPGAGAVDGDDALARKLALLLHVDEPERIDLYRRALNGEVQPGELGLADRRRLVMMAYQLHHLPAEKFTAEAILDLLGAHPVVAGELRDLLDVLRTRISLTGARGRVHPDWPLTVHRTYGRREVLTATGRWDESHKPGSREGVVRLDEAKTELLFVTLDKSAKTFSETTSYADYAISPELFHWQSQSGVGPGSPSGKRYIEQATNGWRFLLFTRPTVDDLYALLGPVHYVGHTGERPMSITWRLEHPIPGHWQGALERLAV